MKSVSSDLQNRHKLAILFNLGAIVVTVLYGWMIFDYYSTYLDSHLRYVSPKIPGAPEDVLGFGFWLAWLMVLFLWLVFEVPAYFLASNRRRQVAIAGILFAIVSMVDFYLAGVLTPQVPT